MLLVLQLTRFVGSTDTNLRGSFWILSFLKTLVMAVMVRFVCSLLVVSTKQSMNGSSLEEQYLVFFIFGLAFVCFQVPCIVSLS